MPTVTGIETMLYGIPNEESLDDATQSFDELELVVVTLSTPESDGLGFTYTIGEGGAAIKSFIDTTLEPILIGGPASPRAARANLRAGTTFVGREGISELGIAAIDIALWDALGRRTKTPMYALIGGTDSNIPAYQTHGGWLQYDTPTLVENTETAADRGFAGFKMKVGRGHSEDASRVRAVREALPTEMDLMLDANCAYSVADAIRLTRHLEVPVDWLEEPLDKGDYAGHARLRQQIDIPIALGENLYNAVQFHQVMAADGADILQPDVCRVGGITPWLQVANMAAAAGLPVSPHYVEPLHIHLATAFENVPYIEHHSTVLDSVLKDPPGLIDGTFQPADDPGHGIRFSELAQYRKSNR